MYKARQTYGSGQRSSLGLYKPNGAGEALISLNAFNKLSPDLQRIVENACKAEHSAALAEAEHQNGAALVELVKAGAKLTAFPADVMKAAREKSYEVIDRKAKASPVAARIVMSWREAQSAGGPGARVGAYMEHALRGA
jgi:TRAP-type mannitol/chloroaromatic compound transport system substrate-binding protein